MSGTTPQGRANEVQPSTPERASLIRTHAVAVVAQLALVAALAGCGLAIRGGYAPHTTRLPNAYPTYAPGPRPQPSRPKQTALADAVGIFVPLVEDVFWMPKYPELEGRDALPGWLQYNLNRPDSVIGGRPPLGRLTHFASL